MQLLFSGFPHSVDSFPPFARAVAVILGVGCTSGCLALLFVAVWEKLDGSEPVKSTSGAFPSEEPPTHPNGYNKKTRRIPIDKLMAEVEKSKKTEE